MNCPQCHEDTKQLFLTTNGQLCWKCKLSLSNTSANHRLCKLCNHCWNGESVPPYDPESWCYMFKEGGHVDRQGFCGQFRLAPAPPSKINPLQSELDECRQKNLWLMNENLKLKKNQPA